MTISYDQLRRRLQDGLETPQTLNDQNGHLPDVSVLTASAASHRRDGQNSAGTTKGRAANMNYSRMDRLKGRMIEDLLPKLNLTSYNNLQRVRNVLQQQIQSEQQRADELRRHIQRIQNEQSNNLHISQEELDALRSERTQVEMNLQRLQYQHEEVNRRLERVSQEYSQLIGQRDQLIQERDSAVRQRDEAVAQRDELGAQRDQLFTQNAQLSAYREQSERLYTHIAGERNRLANEVNMLLHMLKDAQGVLTQQYEPAPPAPPAPDLSALEIVRRVNEELYNPRTLYDVRQTMQEYFSDDQDENLQTILDIYQEAIDGGIPYWDIRTCARVASRVLKPKNYLEVGTRRGWSLAQVLSETPDVTTYVFDVWIENYASAQGNPRSVLNKMQQVTGTTPKIEFINGNSHDTLPQFFNNQIELHFGIPPREFDIITIDGDHSLIGAWQDLYDVFPHVRVGGMILFDDLEYGGERADYPSQYERPPMPDGVQTLRDVWHKLHAMYPNFVFIDCSRLRYQAGIAIRLS
jgi:predicted O-methyltransferase YrrM